MMKGSRRSSAPPDVPALFAQWKGGDRTAPSLPTITSTLPDESSEPSDFGSEPSSPPESDSEPEGDPPEDFDETPPDSEFEDEPLSPPESFFDESFIEDYSTIDESFIDDDDDNLTLPSMSTTTMQNFMGDDEDDGLLPEFGSNDEFDDYIFDELSEPEDDPPESDAYESDNSFYGHTVTQSIQTHTTQSAESRLAGLIDSDTDAHLRRELATNRPRTFHRTALLPHAAGLVQAQVSGWTPPAGAVSLLVDPQRRGPVPVPRGRITQYSALSADYESEEQSDQQDYESYSTRQDNEQHVSLSQQVPVSLSGASRPGPPPPPSRLSSLTGRSEAPVSSIDSSTTNGVRGLPPPPPLALEVVHVETAWTKIPQPPPPAPAGPPVRRNIAEPQLSPGSASPSIATMRPPPPPVFRSDPTGFVGISPPPSPVVPLGQNSSAVTAASSPQRSVPTLRPPPPRNSIGKSAANSSISGFSLEVPDHREPSSRAAVSPPPSGSLGSRPLPPVSPLATSPLAGRALPVAPLSPIASTVKPTEPVTSAVVVPPPPLSPSPPPSPRVELNAIGRPLAPATTEEAAEPSSPVPVHALMPHELIAVSQHETYSKYFKMLKVGIPKPMVQKKMRDEGVNDLYLDLKPDELVPLQETANTIAACEHPLYKKYFKMLKVGLPVSVVKDKMEAEGYDSYVMDLSSEHLVSLSEVKKYDPSKKNVPSGPANTPGQGKKKRLFIQGLDASKLGENSLWAADGEEEDIDLDDAEFERLFVEGDGPMPNKMVSRSVTGAAGVKKILLIDPKRAQNAAISLARIKWPLDQLRAKMLQMDDDGLSVEQLLSLREYLPNNEEVRALGAFKGAVSSLGPAERYMHAMLNLSEGKSRITCMIFRQQFASQVHGCKAQLCQLELACDDVKTCARLKKVLKTILKVGNQMQGGASHVGLSIESLLKLQNTKAFDKKTSVLQYVICIIAKQDSDSLLFVEDIASINIAAKLSLDLISADKTNLRRELDQNLQFLASLPPLSPSGNTNEMRKMHDFLTIKATHQCEDLDKRYAKVSMKYGHLLAYFGEDSTLPCQEFFTLLARFVADFVSVRDKVDQSLKAEERKSANLSKRQSTGKVVTQAMLAQAQEGEASAVNRPRPSMTEKGDDESPERALSRRPSSVRIASGDAIRRRSELLNGMSGSDTNSSGAAAVLSPSPTSSAAASTAAAASARRRSSRLYDGIPHGRSSTTPSTIALIQAQVAMQVQLDDRPTPPPQKPPPPPGRPPPPSS